MSGTETPTTDPETGMPLTWGTSTEMNPVEALMWRAEADPRLRSTIVSVEELDCVPNWERFLTAHEWASRMVPRFRQRVVEPALGIGTPTWATDRDFDLHYHVRRARLPEAGTFSDALAYAEQIAMAAFDKSRAPWEAVLLEGLPEGRAAYILKMHHSTTDGIGAVQLLSQMHSRRREPSDGKPQPPAPDPVDLDRTGLLVRQVAEDARRLPGALRLVGRGAGVLRRPDRALRDAVRYGDSLRRVLADPDAEGSPLLRGRSLSWRFAALDVAFADLRGAAKAHGATLNDAYIAALLGGFRRYHEEMGQPVDAMPIAFPISLRKADDADGGNRFAGARIAGPVGVVDPAERMAIIGAMVRRARDEPAVDGLGAVAPVLARLPGPVISQVAGNMTKANDLQASNVPGIREDAFVAGAQVLRAYGYAPLPGCATMITLVTHGALCCIAINLDPAAITEPGRFGRCVAEGFEEVIALAPHETTPVVRRL